MPGRAGRESRWATHSRQYSPSWALSAILEQTIGLLYRLLPASQYSTSTIRRPQGSNAPEVMDKKISAAKIHVFNEPV